MDAIDAMRLALQEAQQAAAEDEVPVGAVLVYRDQVIAKDHNRIVQHKNPLAHAELLVMQAAVKIDPDPWLLDTTLFVTLEPCTMCTGALVLARVKRIVFGAPDPKAGACGSVFDLARSSQLNHRLEVESGLLQQECSTLLTNFFRKLR
ncbi:MAG: tRNA-specific adenosine deaminase [Acidobacteria bacterium]|nr:MAG: tRNA-specific adenosine deaminase [Acidobacteriota bacterium]